MKILFQLLATHIPLVSQRVCITAAMCCTSEGPYDIIQNSDMANQFGGGIVPHPDIIFRTCIIYWDQRRTKRNVIPPTKYV